MSIAGVSPGTQLSGYLRERESKRMPNGHTPSVTLWACQCCTLVMANGECCDSDSHGGDGKEPLSAIPRGCNASLGLFALEHSEDCANNPEWIGAECDCERREFSWSSCHACDSNLGGSRHAFVIWYPAGHPDTVA